MNESQAVNPFLPSYEYIPDGEPHIFNGRVYLYGSHDKFNGRTFCLNDYVCWSADVNDLSAWKYEGVIFRRKQVPHGKFPRILNTMFAPDVARGRDGKYYLYFTMGYESKIGVAVCDSPAGNYQFLDYVRYEDGTILGEKDEPLQFDPGVFVDDDGQIYLYSGFAPLKYPKFLLRGHKPATQGAMAMRLQSDMVTLADDEIHYVCATKANGENTPFKGHEFFEAPSMRKFNGKYYLIYSSSLNHELCYAVSNNPLGGFTYGGTLISIADLGLNGNTKPLNYYGNTHGSVIKIGEKCYVFYHRQTNRNEFSRQACAEEIVFKNGKFQQAELTSCGLNGGPLAGIGEYKARIACQLYAKNGAKRYHVLKLRGAHPYFTQLGRDREHTPSQHIANFCHGSTAAFKYFNFDGANQIIVTIKGNPQGKLIVSHEPDGKPIAKIRLTPCKALTDFYAPLKASPGKQALYFTYEGMGRFLFKGFVLQQVVRGNKYE